MLKTLTMHTKILKDHKLQQQLLYPLTKPPITKEISTAFWTTETVLQEDEK